jgi:PKD repeat protein
VTLTLTNGVQNATTTTTVQIGSQSGGTGSCPALTAANLAGSYAGATTNCHAGGTCTAGEAIGFRVDLTGYPSNCAISSYSWSSSGGGTSTNATATFTFPNPGDYTVSLTVSNATTPSPVTVSMPVHVVSSQTGACPEMTKNNVFFGWYGNDSTCTPSYGDCKDSETVGFQVYPTAGYSFGCAVHTFTWDFDDGSPIETAQSPTTSLQHKFRSAGIFDVTLTITNTSGGTLTLTNKVRVVNAAGKIPEQPSRHRPSKH